MLPCPLTIKPCKICLLSPLQPLLSHVQVTLTLSTKATAETLNKDPVIDVGYHAAQEPSLAILSVQYFNSQSIYTYSSSK